MTTNRVLFIMPTTTSPLFFYQFSKIFIWEVNLILNEIRKISMLLHAFNLLTMHQNIRRSFIRLSLITVFLQYAITIDI